MSKNTGARLSAVAFLMVGIAIGYIAANGGFNHISVAEADDATTSKEPSQPAQIQPAQNATRATQLTALVDAADDVPEPELGKHEMPSEWAPWKDPNNPNVLLLSDDKDKFFLRRDKSKHTPGLTDPQRYVGGSLISGFPTFLGAPMAFTTEDLKAGEVDLALVGICIGDQPVPGANFAANKMRTLTDWMTFPGGTNNMTGTDYGKLRLADYGNVAWNFFANNQRNVEEVYRVVSEILDADVVPVGIGGTHVQTYAFHTALAKKYGPKTFATLHIDAHYDTYMYGFGRMVHNGSFLKVAIEKGLIDGSDLVQVGLRGESPDAASLAWMRKHKLKFHFQTEIQKDGWDAVLKRVLRELKGKKLHISWDMDGMDPAAAPGVGTQDPDGLTAAQGLQLVRAVAIQNEIVAAEFNEYNPLLDDAHTTTGVLMDRLIRSMLAGIQARRDGITDPLYYDPERLRHDSE
ncbi:MAG: arginase family protein [Rubripirellula sp.]